jgi:hypothetical protein
MPILDNVWSATSTICAPRAPTQWPRWRPWPSATPCRSFTGRRGASLPRCAGRWTRMCWRWARPSATPLAPRRTAHLRAGGHARDRSGTRSSGREFWDRAGVADRIEIVVGDARDTIPGLSGPLDLLFVDAVKGQYREYLELAESLLAERAVLVIDNLLGRRRGRPARERGGTGLGGVDRVGLRSSRSCWVPRTGWVDTADRRRRGFRRPAVI